MKAIFGLAISVALLVAPGAFAQTSYPEQSVRILIGFPAGTAPDVAARTKCASRSMAASSVAPPSFERALRASSPG